MNPNLRINASRCVVAGVFIVFACARSTPVLALTQQEIDWCVGKNATSDFQINGCTAAIQSGKLLEDDLASAASAFLRPGKWLASGLQR